MTARRSATQVSACAIRSTRAGVLDEFLVFQGASYFRAVGRGQSYGLSARGLAVKTADNEGEEFPAFTHFWIERPPEGAKKHRHPRAARKPVGGRRVHVHGAARRRARAWTSVATLFPRVELERLRHRAADVDVPVRHVESHALRRFPRRRARLRRLADDQRPRRALLAAARESRATCRSPRSSTRTRRASASCSASASYATTRTPKRATSCGRRCGSSRAEMGAGPVELVEIPSSKRDATTTSSRTGGPPRRSQAGQRRVLAIGCYWCRAARRASLARVVATRVGAHARRRSGARSSSTSKPPARARARLRALVSASTGRSLGRADQSSRRRRLSRELRARSRARGRRRAAARADWRAASRGARHGCIVGPDKLSNGSRPTAAIGVRQRQRAAAAPLAMPEQSLRKLRASRARARVVRRSSRAPRDVRRRRRRSRAIGAREMFAVVDIGGITHLEWAMVVLFAITFGWIALSRPRCVTGVLFGGSAAGARRRAAREQRTALVMPVYNENPARTFAALARDGGSAVRGQRARASRSSCFPTRRTPRSASKETAAYRALRETLGDRMRVWYRRRSENIGRKAGNMQDFVERWGGRYDFMIVLDADSMSRGRHAGRRWCARWQADPRLGLLQTVPRLAGGHTSVRAAAAVRGPACTARSSRAASRLAGRRRQLLGAQRDHPRARVRGGCGLAASCRAASRSAARSCRTTSSKRRCSAARGWSVRMLPTLGGLVGGSPPSLLDVAARDRRWAQGNIQHLAVVGSRGFTWSNRMHMWIGVMSYLASPLWLR